MAEIGHVTPTKPVWPERHEEPGVPKEKQRKRDDDRPQPEDDPPAEDSPRDDDKPVDDSDDEHVDVYV